MRKPPKYKKLLVTTISISSITLLLSALIVPFTLSAFVKDVESDGFYGEVSLRSYFECGTGRFPDPNDPNDKGDPYVITRPRHLYNLSRLQGLGVFNEPKFFALGLEGLNGDTSGKPLCYLDDSSSTTVPFLDMSDSDYDYEPINAIGSEAVPFFGEFDGQGLEIKNLEVYADPQDAGLFGYTAHGSSVHNLFLDNVTINALGYTDSYAGLYGPSHIAESGTSFTYIVGDDNTTADTFLPTSTDKIKSLEFDASDIFNWDGTGTAPTINTPAPIIGYSSSNSSFKYKILISGDFLVDNQDGTVSVDLETVYKFFKKEKTETDVFPLNASSSISLVASTTDNYGLDHSVVVMTMDFDFSLQSSTATMLTMYAHLGDDHENNIGLIIGHCDGSILDCYVHEGHFKMNNGNSFSNNTYNSMENGSNFGLIGFVGGTVHNIAAEESDAGTKLGKDVGVLDFTTVYNEIIDGSSFTGSTTLTNGVTYTPGPSLKYRDYLRNNGSNYVTLANDTVSFNRQKIITNTDLGIFTIATDNTGSGMYDDAGNGLEKSVVKKEANLTVDSSYYIYYATGEYDKNFGINFAEYRDSLQSDNPSVFYPGEHFPSDEQVTSESFEQRDRHQNYVIRFKVDGNYRTGKGFYFSDVDKDSDGGNFLSMYFENKLVDKNGNPIKAAENSGKSGVMLRNSVGQEIRSFNASYATPDLSHIDGLNDELLLPRMYCVENGAVNDESLNPAANMVNFEVKTAMANVTVVAGLEDITKPAALGVYKIDTSDKKLYNGHLYIDKDFQNPDYAFFMPTDDHLAYFDYKVTRINNEDVGQIGTYNSVGTFTEADIHTNATIPQAYDIGSEYGYATGKTRLYAHTFKLPQGHYCLGSATGKERNDGAEGIAKIFYLCAQGQTDGQISFQDNAFASRDEVKNVDFLKTARYTRNENTGAVTTNIRIPTETVSVINLPADADLLDNQRCYVALANSDRSTFAAQACNINFLYEDNKFKITSDTLSAVNYIAVSNYAIVIQETVTGIVTTPVSLFGAADSTEEKITYPTN